MTLPSSLSLTRRFGGHKRNRTLADGTMDQNHHEQDFGIKRIYIHPEYNSLPASYNYDIALIQLDRPAILNEHVNLACLPDGTVQFPPGTDCWITGWGTLESGGNSPDYLMQAQVTFGFDSIFLGSHDTNSLVYLTQLYAVQIRQKKPTTVFPRRYLNEHF